MKFSGLVALLAICGGAYAYLNWDEVHSRYEEWVGLKREHEARESAERRLKQLENAESDRIKLEEALQKLDKEFTEYKEKYRTSMRSKAPEISIPTLTVSNKEYRDLKIVGIADDSMALAHSGGILRVERSGIPPDLAALLGINQSTPVHARIGSLLQEVAEHKAGRGPDRATAVDAPKSWRSRFGSAVSQAEDAALRSVAIVTVDAEGGTATGAGFIARQGTRTYFYTNAHVAASGTMPKVFLSGGQILKLPDKLEVSDEPQADDLVRFEVGAPEGVTPLQMARSADDVMVDSSIIALGNSGGAGVIPILRGKIKAFGPFALEVDAMVIKGNSGGPVLLQGSDTVVGIVTRYERPNRRDMGIDGTPFSSIRRICLRPDQVTEWKSISLAALVGEHHLLEQCDMDNYLLSLLLRANIGRHGISGLDADTFGRAATGTVGPAIAGYLANYGAEIQRHSQQADANARVAVGRLYGELRSLYGAGITGVDPRRMSRFHGAIFSDIAKLRAKLTAEIDRHLARMASEAR